MSQDPEARTSVRAGAAGVPGVVVRRTLFMVWLPALVFVFANESTSAVVASDATGSAIVASDVMFSAETGSAVTASAVTASGPVQVAAPASVSVEVAGIEGTLLENVRAALSIYQRRDMELTEAEIRRMHGEAPREIRTALQPFGHYHPVIDDELVREEDGFVARYRVEPGPVVEIVEVDFRIIGPASDDEAFQEPVADFPLNEGGRLLHAPYDAAIAQLDEIATRRGYFDASYAERRIDVDLESNTARITIHFESGERFRFGTVLFVQDEFREALLEDYIPFEPGDLFHQSLVTELQTALTGTELFEFVEVDTRPEEGEAGVVPIAVTLEPRQRLQYTLGLGYGTDTGTRGTAGVELRRLNRWGHRAAAEIQASFVRRDASLRYTIPWGGAGNEFALTAAYRDDDLETFRDRTALMRLSLTSGDRLGWREVLYLDLMRADFQVGGVDGVSTLVIPGADWTRTRSDNPIYPRRGLRLGVELRGSHQGIGSDVSFLQATLRAKAVRPVGSSGRFLARADLGGTSVDDFFNLPGSIRYFAGGDRSVRGFGFERLGPMNEDGEPIGGRYLVTASVEYEHLFGESWGAAVFYDAGNALTRFERPISDWLEQGAGIGARWLSPIGMARLDIATAVSRSGFPIRVHFTLGPDL